MPRQEPLPKTLSLRDQLRAAKDAIFNASRQMSRDLAALRSRIADLEAERERVATTIRPRAEAEAVIRAEIARSAASFQLSVAPVVEHGAAFPLHSVDALSAAVQRSPWGVFCGLAPELIFGLVTRDLDAVYAAGQSMTTKARDARLQELDAEILELNLAEEAVIRLSEEAGVKIERRAGVLPEARLARTADLPA